MIAIQTSERNGKVVAATLAAAEDEIMLITTGGVLIRTRVDEIREMGRSTQGVTLINLGEGEKLAGLETIMDRDDENGEERQRQRGNGIGNGNGSATGLGKAPAATARYRSDLAVGDDGDDATSRAKAARMATALRLSPPSASSISAPGRRCCRWKCWSRRRGRCSTGTGAACR